MRPEQARQPRVRKEKGFLDHATDFGTGLWLGGKDAVVGVKDLAVGAFNVSLVGMVVDREQWEESNRNLQQTVSTVVENPAVVWDAIKQPYVEAWEEGRPLEAVGRGTFEVIATVAGTKGLDKVAKGSKATSAVTKLDDVAEAASATAKTTSKVDDAARASTKVDAVAPKAAKAEVSEARMPHSLETEITPSRTQKSRAGADAPSDRGADNAHSNGIQGEPEGLYRRTQNVGPYASLAVNMQLRTVKRIAEEAGIGLRGVKIRIVRDQDLVGRGLFGRAEPGRIDLYPDAFTDTETLVRTLGHERTHVMQYQVHGRAGVESQIGLMEEAAYAIEDSFVEYYRTR